MSLYKSSFVWNSSNWPSFRSQPSFLVLGTVGYFLIRYASLHKRAKLDPMQERLQKLRDKLFTKISETYFNKEFEPKYKSSDYNIPDPPINPRSNKVKECFQNHGFLPWMRKPITTTLPFIYHIFLTFPLSNNKNF